MREIEFRAQSKHATNYFSVKDWVYGYYAEKQDDHVISFVVVDDFGNPGYDMDVIITPETVSQFTGLTDKNGVKIFEHDICIVKIPRIDGAFNIFENMEVMFESGMFVLNNGYDYKKFSECGYPDTVEKNIEVIGNIHDGEVK